jgi:hypothetical protein
VNTPDEKSKKEQLQRVPTRKLLASIKREVRLKVKESKKRIAETERLLEKSRKTLKNKD